MRKVSQQLAVPMAAIWFLSTTICIPAFAEDGSPPLAPKVNMEELYNLPVDQLAGMDYIVTSAAKKEEKILDTAAAIYVINQEDIRRSGATSVPEVLRMAPGVDVARINASQWAISIRGFNNQYGNKLLVLVDGRSVYTPLFSGVLWDEQTAPLPLEDIERIEIIRGPGATLYGANAMNGVINIISKQAKDTQGNLVTVGGGNIDRAFGTYRYGGHSGDTYYRAYVASQDTMDSEITNTGVHSNFDWHTERAGFRADSEIHGSGAGPDQFTLQGDVFSSHENNIVNGHTLAPVANFIQAGQTDPEGGNILARWTHAYSSVSKLQLQAYVDDDNRIAALSGVEGDFSVHINNYDVEMQHSYSGWERNDIIWGLGGRITETHVSQREFIGLIPASSTTHVLNAFGQDEIALIPNKWTLTLGSKFEQNSYTGFEIEPSIRTLWKLTGSQSLWAAVSRAVRTPSAFERNSYLTTFVAAGPFQGFLLGQRDLSSEKLIAYETGYRAELAKSASIDATVFYNDYSHLIGSEPIGGGSVMFSNDYHGGVYGLEIAPTWNPTDNWKLKGSYSLLKMNLQPDGDSTATTAQSTNHQSPTNQFSVQSYLSLPHHTELDAALYYVDELSNFSVPAYWRGDLRLGWKPLDDHDLELSLVGQNLFDHSHYEMQGGNPAVLVPIPRSFIGKITWKF